jgi:hypothetical protein
LTKEVLDALQYALTLQALVKYKQAENNFNKALQIKLRTIGPDHYSVAFTYFSMGMLFEDAQKNFDKDLEYLAKAHHIYVRTVGESHRSTSNLDQWVNSLRGQRDKSQAAAAGSGGGTRAETGQLFHNISKFFEHQQGMDNVWRDCLKVQAAGMLGVTSSMTMEEMTDHIFGVQYNDT